MLNRLLLAAAALALAALVLAWANRGVVLLESLRWPTELAAFGFAAAVVFWLRQAPPAAGSRGVLGLALAAVAVAAGSLLHQAVVAGNARTGGAPVQTHTALVADLAAHVGWDGRGGCAVRFGEWPGGDEALVLPDSAPVQDAAGALVACRTAASGTLRRGERVAVRTRVGGLGLAYLADTAGAPAVVPPCATCGAGDGTRRAPKH